MTWIWCYINVCLSNLVQSAVPLRLTGSSLKTHVELWLGLPSYPDKVLDATYAPNISGRKKVNVKERGHRKETTLHLLSVFSSCLWHILHIRTIKLLWNAAMMSVWQSAGRFEVDFCRAPHACHGRNRWDSETSDDTTQQPCLTRVWEACLRHLVWTVYIQPVRPWFLFHVKPNINNLVLTLSSCFEPKHYQTAI